MLMKNPHQLLDNQVCHSLYSATNALIRAYRPLLEPLGLTYPQYLVMLSLWERDGVSISALGQHTRLDGGTLTPLLRRLEQKGLLTRKQAAGDERQKVISLTPRGRKLQKAAASVPVELASRGGMSLADAQQLKALCEHLFETLGSADS
jgi:MarR family transcriptional regulator, organic hydroperoxide resistance regulator